MMSLMVSIDDTGSSIHGKNIRVLFFSLGKAGSARRRCSPQVLLGFLRMQQHVYRHISNIRISDPVHHSGHV